MTSKKLTRRAALKVFGAGAASLALPMVPYAWREADAAQVLESEQVGNITAIYAKLLASGVFVCGRCADDVIENDLEPASRGLLPIDEIGITVDETEQFVRMNVRDFVPRKAVYVGDQGCTVLPLWEEDVFFDPVEVSPDLPDAEAMDWPMGDRNGVEIPNGADDAALEAMLDFAFDDDQHDAPQRTRALVVIHDGSIVAERYAPGFDKDSRHISWSMGKGVTSALIGVLAQRGVIDVEAPAPIPAWHADPDDPRSAITVKHLLQMTGGLEFGRGSEEAGTAFTAEDDHTAVYSSAVNVFDFSINRPLEHEPGAVWRYLNCDPLCLGWIMRDKARELGESYLAFPQRALFDKIGSRRTVLECDPWGNFIMTGYNYATARDWARFGMLHINDGVFEGERILPEGWTDFVSTPADASEARNYGAQFWLNAGGQYDEAPRDMFWAAGQYGQSCFMIPSRNTVVVRLGHSVEGGYGGYIREILTRTLDALPEG